MAEVRDRLRRRGAPEEEDLTPAPSQAALARLSIYIGCTSVGGPAAQIALLRREYVERRGWIDSASFDRALAFCTFLPGPEAQQLATYLGFRLCGVRGGITAGVWFVLPGFLAIVALAWLTFAVGRAPSVDGALLGLRAAAVALVAAAVPRLAKSLLKTRGHVVVAALSFFGVVGGLVPFPLVVAAAALYGAFRQPSLTDASAGVSVVLPKAEAAPPAAPDPARSAAHGAASRTAAKTRSALRTLGIGLVCWWTPLVALTLLSAVGTPTADVASFFSRAALVTFGGAYAVLAYVDQAAVGRFGWLTRSAMIDGLGLAESTPGPLILVVSYVGFAAGWNRPGNSDPAVAGWIGATAAAWASFAPSILLVFLGAPFIESLPRRPRVRAALSFVAAAVVGVVASLAVRAAVAVWFPATLSASGPFDVRFDAPDLPAIALSVSAAVALHRFRRGPIPVLLAAVAAGMAIRMFGG